MPIEYLDVPDGMQIDEKKKLAKEIYDALHEAYAFSRVASQQREPGRSLGRRIPVARYLFEEARRKELRNLCRTLSPFRTVDTGPEELPSLFGATMPFQGFGESTVFVLDDGKILTVSPLGS